MLVTSLLPACDYSGCFLTACKISFFVTLTSRDFNLHVHHDICSFLRLHFRILAMSYCGLFTEVDKKHVKCGFVSCFVVGNCRTHLSSLGNHLKSTHPDELEKTTKSRFPKIDKYFVLQLYRNFNSTNSSCFDRSLL